MESRCVVIPAIKKNAVIPDQLVKRLAGTTLIERGIETARGVVPGSDVYVLTDSQEISLISERAGVEYRCNESLKFKTLNIVSEMREVLLELGEKYEHIVILRASCPLMTWVDVEDAWHRYLDAGADALVTVKSVHQRIWGVQGRNLEYLLNEDEGEREVVIESRAIIILRSAPLLEAFKTGRRACIHNVVPYFLNDRAIEIQSYQDWWICEHLLMRRHLVFVVAGWPAIGMGHIYRALMLAHEITAHKITFVCTRESELAVESVARKDYRSIRQGDEELWETVLKLHPDVVINDILNTDALYMGQLRNAGVHCVNFEDEGEGAALADCVINALYPEQDTVPGRYCGPRYFCLRDEFVGATRNEFRPLKTVLITFGGTDQYDCSRRVLDIVEPWCREHQVAIRIVAGPGYAHRYDMEAHVQELANPLVSFTWSTNVMSRMMEGADLCICSAGRTVYELAHMRIPTMVLATHEREARHTFARPGNGFLFVGLMAKVTDQRIKRCFEAMTRDSLRSRLYSRMCRIDFTQNKPRVIRLISQLLEQGDDGTESDAGQEA